MLIIRADGNVQIGIGHLMRCMTVGEAVRSLNGNDYPILFICANGESAQTVSAHGFEADILNTDLHDMDGELDKLALCLSRHSNVLSRENIILVDSYYVTDTYLLRLKEYGKVYLMDDMQDHAYPVDGIINYNIFANLEIYEDLYKGKAVEFYLGNKYIPLRKQFMDFGYTIKDIVRDVLITTGGGDESNIAAEILNAIYRSENITYHILVGHFNTHLESWRRRLQESRNIKVHYDISDVAGLMAQCDMAVTAGGSTIYELSALGIPFICFSYADNQNALVDYIGNTKTAGCAGKWNQGKQTVLDSIREQFEAMCDSKELRSCYYERERNLVDGEGAYRIAEILQQ
ncbi:MAG: UDP-2,4-diacetamido-2,4,6-trideoxy-beta-L-altropyranose hydrolase [Clostridiales bacterium]|nr:UDP-2,4-diacetamido-2,4,6-trideoxy-beta-L-altropyranose hydrolase [Clostridiales bacterium]